MFDMTENNKIDFETIDYSKVNPKKLNGNKRIVKSYLIYFAFDVVLTVAIFLLTLFKLIDSSDNTVNTVIFILSGILCLCLYANNYYKSKDWRFYESLRSDTLTKLIALFFVINGVLLLLTFNLAGVHISIVASWGGAAHPSCREEGRKGTPAPCPTDRPPHPRPVPARGKQDQKKAPP